MYVKAMKPLTNHLPTRLAAFCALLASSLAWAQTSQPITAYEEYSQHVQQSRELIAVGENPFGEQISLYTGATEFAQTDVSLSGNSALPVAVTRRNAIGDRDVGLVPGAIDGLFGDWELELPHLRTTTGYNDNVANGWVVGTSAPAKYQRCSDFAGVTNVGGVGNFLSVFPYESFANGVHLEIPGLGSQEVLIRQDAPTPTDGNQYPLVTKDFWAIQCLPNLHSAGTELGEGFEAVAPDGTRYRFDWLVYRRDTPIKRHPILPVLNNGQPLRVPVDGDVMARDEAQLYATQVTDRFGNWVKYEFDPSDPRRLTRIHANDGRELLFTYHPSTSRIQSITHGTRTWSYEYVTHSGSSTTFLLNKVTRPDASTWQFALGGLLTANTASSSSAPACGMPGKSVSTYSGSITHPTGLVGTFNFKVARHGRSYVQKICQVPPNSPSEGYLVYPHLFDTVSIASRAYSGPGISGSHTWTYDYGVPVGSFTTDCTNGCPETKSVTVTDPVGTQKTLEFGNRFQTTEGLLVSETVTGRLGDLTNQWLQTTEYRYRLSQSGNLYPALMGVSLDPRTDGTSAKLRPQDQRVISRPSQTAEADAYVWEAQSFDAYAQPSQVRRYSAVGTQAASTLSPILGTPETATNQTSGIPSTIYFSVTETQTYSHDLAKWVLSQPSQTDTLADANQRATTPVRIIYDPATRLPFQRYEFGRLVAQMTYHPNGQLATLSDGANPPMQLTDYRFGLARSVTYPDQTQASAVVNDLGQLESVTNEIGATTSYQYDPMGRLARIIYPVDPGQTWLDTIITTERVSSAEFGIAAGHWRRTTATGNAREIEYFDAYGRALIVRRFDTGQTSTTETAKLFRFDGLGQATFASYPARQISSINANVPGVRSRFDGLGRIDRTEADSELSSPSISTRDFRLALGDVQTDARGTTTQVVYQRFDQPDDRAPVIQLAAANRPLPDRILTFMTRDDFGKVRLVQRSGHDGVGPSGELFQRDFRYDSAERLCLIHDPEAGLTRFGYNLAGDLNRSVEGTSLPAFPGENDVEQCGASTPFPPATTVNRQYDARHRQTGIDFPGATADIGITFTPDGLVETQTSANTVWTMSYYRRGPLKTETLTVDGRDLPFVYQYDSLGSLRNVSYPNGLSIAYTPDALGQPTQVGNFLSQVRHHPNGMPSAGTYANGIQFETTLSTRSLLERVRHTRPDTSTVFDELTRYDAAGNVSSIEDPILGTATRTLTHDWHNRLQNADAPGLWGQIGYTYDSADNIRGSTFNADSKTYQYNTQSKRLDAVSATNAPTVSFGYDNRGNVTTRGATVYTFDLANRLTEAAGNTYRYDARGKRVSITKAGRSTLQVYGQNHRLLYEERPLDLPADPNRIFRNGFESAAANQTVEQVAHVYLGNQLIGTETRPIHDGVPQSAVRRYRHVDQLGSPIVSTDASASITDIERYTPFGEPVDGNTSTGPSYTGHVSDADTGLVYMGARYYDPSIGRAISIDPEPVDPYTGGNFNRYWYGNNSPYRFTDPDGRTGAFVGVQWVAGAAAADAAVPEPSDVAAPIKVPLYASAFAGALIGGGIYWVGSKLFSEEATPTQGESSNEKPAPGRVPAPFLPTDPYSPEETSKRQSGNRAVEGAPSLDPDSAIPDRGPGSDQGGHVARGGTPHLTGERNVNSAEEHSRRAKGNPSGTRRN